MSDPVDNQNANNGSSGGDGEANADKNIQPPAVAPVAKPTQPGTKSAQYNAHYSCKKSVFDIATRVIEIVVGVVVGGALISVGYLQYSVYTRQAGIMEADQRPWISSSLIDGIFISKPLTFDPVKGGFMQISYVLKNTGKSPALHAVWRSKLLVMSMTKFINDEFSEQQNTLCNPMRTKSRDLFDVTIFPGDILPPQGWGLDLSRPDIEAALKGRESGSFAHSGFISLGLIACVDYQSSLAPIEHHQTRYAFELGIPIGDGSAFMGDIKPEGTPDGIRLIYFSQSAD
jgi:hypothetical protein